jgi:glycosyltransferase involved in cell wall biosynthesis
MAPEPALRIVYFGADASWRALQRIGFRRRNTCLLREFARHPLVGKLAVVIPTTRGHAYLQSSWWQLLLGFKRHEKVQDVFVFAFLPGQRWAPAIRRFNLYLARWLIRRALAECDQSKVIQWCYWPAGYVLARQIGLKGRIVFDADNNILTCPTLAPERPQLERLLKNCVQNADAVVCGSKKFLLRSPALGLKRPTFLRNGVDAQRFRCEAAEPEDLQGIPRPRLGYLGTLSQWIDFEILLLLARENPKWNIVCVGDPYLAEVPEALKKLANVHFLGARAAFLVPAYLKNVDVGLVPYRQEAGGSSDGDSMKIFEYLAAGLPVVAADFNGRLAEDFEGLVEIAAHAVGFARAIERVLNQSKEGRREWDTRRQEFLRRNTWRCRADEAVALMKGLLS